MTTRHTPYDTDIAAIEAQDRWKGDDLARLNVLRCRRDGYLEGCLAAKAEDALLLAAAKAVLSYPARGEKVCLADIADDPCTCRGHDALAALRAAIAAATEGPSGGRTPEGEKEERT